MGPQVFSVALRPSGPEALFFIITINTYQNEVPPFSSA